MYVCMYVCAVFSIVIINAKVQRNIFKQFDIINTNKKNLHTIHNVKN